jgi:hypothetical protein
VHLEILTRGCQSFLAGASLVRHHHLAWYHCPEAMMIVQAQAARGMVTNHCSTRRAIRLQRWQLVVDLAVE